MNNNYNQKIIEDINNFIEIGIDVGWSDKRKSSCIAFISKENPFDPSLNQFIANNWQSVNLGLNGGRQYFNHTLQDTIFYRNPMVQNR